MRNINMFKRNINIFKIAVLLGTLFFSAYVSPVVLNGKNTKGDIRVEFDKTTVNHITGIAHTEMVININKVYVPKRCQMRITPYLQKGQNTMVMPSVVINGSIRNRLIKRQEAFSGEKDLTEVAGVARNRKHSQKIKYMADYSAEQWMTGSQLMLLVEYAGCAGEVATVNDDIINNNLRMLPASYVADIIFIEPERELVKSRDESGDANIMYIVGRHDIRPDLSNNYNELNKILRSIDYVKGESTARISRIMIRSYASPEGTWYNNQKLSERRAASLAQWIRNKTNMSGIEISYMGLGEDWEGLEMLVMEDPMLNEYDKAYIRELNNSATMPDSRENRLMMYNNGRTYSYLLSNIYPKLRRSHYTVEYTVPGYSFEKSKEVYQTRPKMLSVAELYYIANEYEQGSPEFRETLEQAAKLFPNDKIANMNAGAAQLISGDIYAAKAILEQYKNEPQAWVNLANIAAAEGDFNLAENYLRQAQRANIPGTVRYLENLSAYRGLNR